MIPLKQGLRHFLVFLFVNSFDCLMRDSIKTRIKMSWRVHRKQARCCLEIPLKQGLRRPGSFFSNCGSSMFKAIPLQQGLRLGTVQLSALEPPEFKATPLQQGLRRSGYEYTGWISRTL